MLPSTRDRDYKATDEVFWPAADGVTLLKN